MKFGGRIRILKGGFALLAPLASGEDSPTVGVTTATTLEIVRAGKTMGTVGLAESTKPEALAIEEEFRVSCSSIPTGRCFPKLFAGGATWDRMRRGKTRGKSCATIGGRMRL